MQCITDSELRAFRALIGDVAGIALGESKRELIVSRLGRRLRHHGLQTFGEYYRLLTEHDPLGVERVQMINCITTNKTEFFRERNHFDLLARRVLPDLNQRGSGPIRVWSAACSTGEEPYSIAITALDALGAQAGERVKILASDIDTEVLSRAASGVYATDSLNCQADSGWHRHFLQGRNESAHLVRVRPELRRMVTFRRINLIDPTWPISGRFDVIFCRNVMIYFARQTQRDLVARFARHLEPGGWLMVGHTENLQWISDEFEVAGPTAYRLRAGAKAAASPAPIQPVKIVAGGVFASREPAEVRTLLGSCIAACLFDPQAMVGGMNHFLLARGADGPLPNRYGIHAMEMLINEIMRLGGDRRRLRAKVFGGAEVLDVFRGGPSVSRQNIQFIETFLHTERIPIVAKRVGGRVPMEVRFETHTARARVRLLDTHYALSMARQERRIREQLATQAAESADHGVTLF